MPQPTKRGRSTAAGDENERDESSESPDASTPPRRAVPRRSPARRSSTTTPTRDSSTPSRTLRTRITLSTPSPALTRSTSHASPLFRTSSRGANSSASLDFTSPSMAGTRTAVLTRAASMSAVPALGLGQIKEMVAGGGSAPPPTKGGSDPDSAGPSGRGWGKGKENIPPPKDAEVPESSRKRIRVSRRASATPSTSRGRSASVASVRSESGSASVGQCSSFADFSSRRTSSCLPSPSPSPSIATASTYDHITSPRLETIDDDVMDVDDTPTKKGKRPLRTAAMLLTPPPSSPVSEDLVDAIESVNVHSRDASRSPSRDTPTAFTNAYRALKAALRLSSAPAGTSIASGNEIVGRDDEKAVLQSYLSLVSSSDVGMYVSGPPGTGKTALTTAVGRGLAAQGWRVAEVGVMGLRATDVWARLGDELGCGRSEEDIVAHLGQRGSKTYIILDEIDSLLPPPPALPTPATSHVLSKIFSLPLTSSSDATVKLVAISNTLDLTVRANLVLADGAMPQVLPFRAYNSTDMAPIVAARIAAAGDGPDAAKVDTRAVELLCRKVEAHNGDLRMCLGVLSSAVGLAEAEWVKKTGNNPVGADRPMIKVALPHILKAFTSHTQQLRAAAGSSSTTVSSATGSKIRSVPLQGRMVLVSMLVFLARTRAGLAGCPAQGATSESLTVSALYATYAHLLSHATSPFPPSPESDYRDLLSNLETLGLVKAVQSIYARGPRSGGHAPRLELCVREDEVKTGLGIGGTSADLEKMGMAEQEVLRVWLREDERIVRVRARATAAIERAVEGLEDPI